MAAKRSSLGIGLDTLLGPMIQEKKAALDAAMQAAQKTLSVSVLERASYQPRREMRPEALEELANSIRAQGIIQPIIVRIKDKDKGLYEIIAGERRFRAAKIAGLTEVPVVVKEVSDQAAIAMALIENVQREDLDPLEEAEALHRLIETCGLTHQEVATAIGKSRVTVTHLLRLLSLPFEVKQLLRDRLLEMGHARALLSLTGSQQISTAKMVAEKALSVRQTEEWVRRLQQTETSAPPVKKAVVDPDIARLQQSLEETLGTTVSILHNHTKGRGKLVITYYSVDELDGILSHIQIAESLS